MQYHAPKHNFILQNTISCTTASELCPYQTQGNWPRPQVIQPSQRLEGQFSQARPKAPPNKKYGQLTHGRVYTIGNVTSQAEHELVEGTFLVFNSSAIVLFDGGTTHLFISKCFASTLGLETKT